MTVFRLLCKVIGLTLMLTNSGAFNEINHCVSPFINISNGCYYFSDVNDNWFQSLKTCDGMGSSLTDFESVEEFDDMRTYLIEEESEYNWWIGASDDHQENVFVWIRTLELVEFGNWSDNEPNNYNGENCVSMSASQEFFWQDNSCDDSSRRFICRR